MSSALSATTALPVIRADSIDSYLQSLKQFPILSAEEEQKLATRLYEEDDVEAARQLIVSHLRFVAHIARGYLGYGLPLADIVQEGNIGLMKAVRRFDPNKNVRLISFAVHWIRAEIHEYVLRNWRIVKIATTKAQRKLFFNLRSAKKRLGWLSREEVETVAQDLGVEPATVLEMEQRLSHSDTSFDLPALESEEENSYSPAAYLEAPEANPAETLEQLEWDNHTRQQMMQAFGELDERSRDILSQRWLTEKKATLHTLADQYDVSAERIRQLEKAAIKKLQATLAPAL